MTVTQYQCITKTCKNKIDYKGRGAVPDFCEECKKVRGRIHTTNSNRRARGAKEMPLPEVDRRRREQGKVHADKKPWEEASETKSVNRLNLSDIEFVNACIVMVKRIAHQSQNEDSTAKLRVLGNAQTSLSALIEVYKRGG